MTIINRIKKLIETYLTTVKVDDILSDADVDVYENPSSRELMKDIMPSNLADPRRGVRFIITQDLKTYVWRWDEATHGSVWNRLRLDPEVVGGIAEIINLDGKSEKKIAFDLGSRSLNKHSGFSKEEMVDMFFKSPLAKALAMNDGNTEVEFFTYGL